MFFCSNLFYNTFSLLANLILGWAMQTLVRDCQTRLNAYEWKNTIRNFNIELPLILV
jgi:hypothetical protein